MPDGVTEDEFCKVFDLTHGDLAIWRSEDGFADDLEAVCKNLHRQTGVPALISAARARALDSKLNGEEQRRWMYVFLKLVDSPLGKPSIFAEQ